MTERTTGGQSNFLGTRTEETIIVTKKKKIASKWWWVFLLLELLHCQIYRRMWLGVLPEMQYYTTKCALVRKARGRSFMVDDTDQNCTTNWSIFYW